LPQARETAEDMVVYMFDELSPKTLSCLDDERKGVTAVLT